MSFVEFNKKHVLIVYLFGIADINIFL